MPWAATLQSALSSRRILPNPRRLGRDGTRERRVPKRSGLVWVLSLTSGWCLPVARSVTGPQLSFQIWCAPCWSRAALLLSVSLSLSLSEDKETEEVNAEDKETEEVNAPTFGGVCQQNHDPLHWAVSLAQILDLKKDSRCVIKTIMNVTDEGSSKMRALTDLAAFSRLGFVHNCMLGTVAS